VNIKWISNVNINLITEQKTVRTTSDTQTSDSRKFIKIFITRMTFNSHFHITLIADPSNRAV